MYVKHQGPMVDKRYWSGGKSVCYFKIREKLILYKDVTTNPATMLLLHSTPDTNIYGMQQIP